MPAAAATTTFDREEVFRAAEGSLAAAYMSQFEALADFYAPTDWRTPDGLMAGVQRAQEWSPLDSTRIRLGAELRRYLRSLGAPKASLKSAELIPDRDCVAVVTGQQPGLAGGPLMLLHKVAHTVSLAEQLREKGVPAVPVFWAASEDHDLAEVNQFNFLSEDGRLKTLRLSMPGAASGAPLEAMSFDPSDQGWEKITAAVQAEANRSGDPALASETLNLLQHGRETSFGVACNRMLLRLFGHRGLVVLEPRVLRRLDMASAVIGREVMAASPKSRLELKRPREKLVAAGFTPVLDEPDEALFWLVVKGVRYRVAFHDGSFHAACFKTPRSREQMIKYLESFPGRFSCGVRLRPVMQGACLPVLAYVGGPAEIAYHAELRELFEWHGVPMPALIPRWSGTLCTAGESAPRARTAVRDAGEAASRASAAAAEFLNESRNLLATLTTGLGPVAPAVTNELGWIAGRSDKTIRELVGRISSDPLKARGAVPAVLAETGRLYPGGQPQERVLNWLALWPRWGNVLREWWQSRDPFEFRAGEIRE